MHMGQVKFERPAFQDQHQSDYHIGGNIGAAITFPVMAPFSLHAELLYTMKGKSLTIPDASIENTARYSYIEMPIMMRIEIWPQEAVFLGIGPNLSYWVGGTGKLDDLETPAEFTKYDIYFGDNGNPDDLRVTDPNRLQLGLLFGIGKRFELQDDRKLIIEMRFEMGHSFLGTEDGAYLESLDFNDNLESKYRLLSLNLGYFWSFHKKSKRKRSSTYKAKQRK